MKTINIIYEQSLEKRPPFDKENCYCKAVFINRKTNIGFKQGKYVYQHSKYFTNLSERYESFLYLVILNEKNKYNIQTKS